MTTWTDDEAGGTVWSEDEVVSGAALTGALTDVDNDKIPIWDESADLTKYITPKELVANTESFVQSGTGATATTVQDELRAAWVRPEQFGAVGDGVTNDSAAIIAAIAALPTGGGMVKFYRGKRYACNIGAITKANVHFYGDGYYPSVNLSAQLVPFNTNDWVMEIGDGTTQCLGFQSDGVSYDGLATGKKGIKINGADNCLYMRGSAEGFTEQGVYITSSAAQFTAYQDFVSFTFKAQNGASSIGLEIDYGSNFVAALFFTNCKILGQTNSLWAMKMTRVNAFFTACWFQVVNGKGISLNTSGGGAALMECANVRIDSDSAADVLINVDSNTRPNDWVRGTVTVDGVMALLGGNTAQLTSRTLLPGNSYLTSCFVNGSGLFFLDSNLSEWARWDQSATQMSILRNNTNFQFNNSAGGFNMVGAAGSAYAITGRELRLTDNSGQRTSITHAISTVSGMSGATVTATNLIPAGSVVLGVTIRVTTAITGATSFEIGDGTDADRWGTAIAVASGTTTTNANTTITSVPIYAAATSVVLTANGGNFASGAVKITVHYIPLVAATS